MKIKSYNLKDNSEELLKFGDWLAEMKRLTDSKA